MKKIFLMLATAATVCLAACSTETEESITPSANRITISPSISLTRATEVNFEEGDRIGLSIIRSDGSRHAENALLTHDGNVFAGNTTWYTGTDEASHLVAYHPYNAAGAPTTFTVAADQSGDGYAQSDLMGASKADVEPSASAVGMVFKHLLTKININITNETTADVTSVALQGAIPAAGVDLKGLTAEVSALAPSGNITAQPVTANELYRAIVVPQEVALTLKVTTSEEETLSYPLTAVDLKQGGQYTIEVTVLADVSELEATISGEIENWTDEGKIGPEEEILNSRITWDAATSRYALTTDPTDAGLYFKFGSVAGVFSAANKSNLTLPGSNSDKFDPADVAWSPVEITGIEAAGWATVPVYDGTTDYPKAITPAAGYHTAANVKLGKGDPCRLVGLDLNKIAATDAAALTAAQIDNGLWRLPTIDDNKSFTGLEANSSYYEHWTKLNGVNGGMFPNKDDGDATTFLPAAGGRGYTAGGVSGLTSGNYWSSTPYSATYGYYLGFASRSMGPLTNYHYANGYSVRCVRQ